MEEKTVVDVFEQDILLGRGKRSNNWPGNIRFRRLVDAQQNAYMTASDDVTRDAIAYEIANTIERQGGRFLRETVVDLDGAPRSAWVVVEGATIRTKVKQALRDSAKAKARGNTNRDESNTVTSTQSRGRSQRDTKDSALSVGSSSLMASAKRRSSEFSLAHPERDQQQDRKRPAIDPDPSHLDLRFGIGPSDPRLALLQQQQQQQQLALGLPTTRPSADELFGHHTAEQQLRSAIEREQQLSLLRALTSGQHPQDLLRLDEERMALATALSLQRAVGILPSSYDQLPFRNPPSIGPPGMASGHYILDQLRWMNNSAPTDPLEALRLRQSISLDPSSVARQSLFGGRQFDLLGGTSQQHPRLFSDTLVDRVARPLQQQEQRPSPPLNASSRKSTKESKTTLVAAKQSPSEEDGDDGGDDESTVDDPEYDPEVEM